MVADDRGQLILVGSIAIAIVLIGLTLVLNSAVFTENVDGGSSPEITGEAAEFDREAVRNVKSLSVRLAHGHAYPNTTSGREDLTGDLRANTSDYAEILAETYASTGSVSVDVNLNETTNGTRVVQREDGQFEEGGDGSWTPVDGSLEVGWFVVNLDVENMSTDPATIRIDNSSDELALEIRRPDADSDEIEVRSYVSGTAVGGPETCHARNGRVLLNVLDGTQYSGSVGSSGCSFTGVERLDSPFSDVEFEDGHRLTGKFDVVVNDTDANARPGSCASSDHDQPCTASAVWSVEFSTHYRTGSFSHMNTHDVVVYDE